MTALSEYRSAILIPTAGKPRSRRTGAGSCWRRRPTRYSRYRAGQRDRYYCRYADSRGFGGRFIAARIETCGAHCRLPGIGTLKHLSVKKGERIVVCRDGDEPGSSADEGLVKGVDHLLLEGADVRVTNTPAGEDANSILQAEGTSALNELIADAAPATLSLDGEITRLSRLDPLDYDRERKAAAERLGIRVGHARQGGR